MWVRAAIAAIAAGRTLGRDESRSLMASVMAGEATAAQLGALLAMVQQRGESPTEIAGFAVAMREAALPVRTTAEAIDTCGTGGDGSGSLNISTAAAIVAAAAGASVAKHGNRAASSRCGSADVLEALGVTIDLGPEAVAASIERVGLGFMYAPRYHPAMRHAAPVRRELGIRTVFNLLGPLANPAGVRRQLLGVPTLRLGPIIARALLEVGTDRALVVHGAGGLDEISPFGESRIWEIRDGRVSVGRIDPAAVGLRAAPVGGIDGGDAERNALLIRRVLDGEPGAARTAVLLNAGAALYVAALASSIRQGVDLAARTVDSGRAAARLEAFAATTRSLAAAAA